jgi:polyisoprenoid-binding protein YceI
MSTAQTSERTLIPAGTWTVDPVHSHVGFQVHDTSDFFKTITGRFTDFEGVIEGGEHATARGVIKVDSVNTDQPQRDEHLKSPDFFEAASNPEIRFESKSIETVGENKLRVDGTLTIRGSAQDVSLETTFHGAGADNDGNERIVLDAGGEIGFGPMRVKLTVDVSAVKNG